MRRRALLIIAIILVCLVTAYLAVKDGMPALVGAIIVIVAVWLIQRVEFLLVRIQGGIQKLQEILQKMLSKNQRPE